MKYGITANLTADSTVNTDFAQVEIDEQQVNLTRFSLFFPEKREFFPRGSRKNPRTSRVAASGATGPVGSTDTPSLYYSRRIGLATADASSRSTAASRVTGKIGEYGLRHHEHPDGT